MIDSLEKLLVSHLIATPDLNTPIAYYNSGYEPDPSVQYIAEQVMPAVSIGMQASGAIQKHAGIYELQVNTPLNIGRLNEAQVIDKLTKRFERGTILQDKNLRLEIHGNTVRMLDRVEQFNVSVISIDYVYFS